MNTRNSLSEYRTIALKSAKYNKDVKLGAFAVNSKGNKIPLKDVMFDDVEFIGGLWRIQNKFPYEIKNIRNTNFVILKRLPRQEKNLFEFFEVSRVGQNCYGYFITESKEVAAKYETNRGTFWAYGDTIEKARAFLGIKLYDEFQDVIHKFAHQKQK